jgi:hypothetical protein
MMMTEDLKLEIQGFVVPLIVLMILRCDNGVPQPRMIVQPDFPGILAQ